MVNRLFKTYKNSVMPHVNHMFQIASDISVSTMCAYPSSNCALPRWKCVLRCCAQFPQIDISIP